LNAPKAPIAKRIVPKQKDNMSVRLFFKQFVLEYEFDAFRVRQ